MVKHNFNDPGEVSGYERYWQDTQSKGILVPIGMGEDLALANAREKKAAIEKEIADKIKAIPVLGGQPLPQIAIHTNDDIADAILFASNLLADVVVPALLSAQWSEDLLVGILMFTAYCHPERGMSDVIYQLIDPLWATPKQIVCELRNARATAFAQPAAAAWFTNFDTKLDTLYQGQEKTMTAVFKAANRHWSNALEIPPSKRTPAEVKSSAQVEPPHWVIQVFSSQALEKAVASIVDMHHDRQGAGERILEQARAQGGRRTLPDTQQAGKNLEAKKLEFENLVQPIERLQSELAMASAMSPQAFRISPLLLLGDPGIGKTYLASQLANALGVRAEKISAGGAQGGFQLSGSHGAWMGAKPGMVTSFLAKSASASPVLIIDEVDKIRDDRYPLLPVLLDLLDAGTARQFRDEYFEMEFDASRLIVVMTANDISNVPPPLLSRVEVFTIPSPDPEQRQRIIEQTVAKLCQQTKRHIRLAAGTAERLAERMDIDLRQLHRLVSVAYSDAMENGAKVAYIRTTAGNLGRVNLRTWSPIDSLLH